MNKQRKNDGFTLVELLVSIVILSVLGTISFISLQGYSEQARDSTRISDLSTMKTALELFQLNAGKYPLPTSGMDISYSGATVWTQGTFGETVFSNLSKLDKKPVDPATQREYSYSVTATKNEYQLGGMLEGAEMAFFAGDEANAAEVQATAYTTGNFNGQLVQTMSGTICNVLSVPSITSRDLSQTDLQQIVSSGSLVYRGYNNLPPTYKGSKFKTDGGFDFQPNNLVVYSDNQNCTALTDANSYTARVSLLKGLQTAYSGTVLKNEGEIKNIVALSIDTNSPSTDVINYAATFVNNVLNGSVTTGGSSMTSTGTVSTSGWRALDSNCDIDDITIGTQTWAGCNSTLGTGVEWGKTDAGAIGTVSNCYPNYNGTNDTTNCVIGSTAMASTTKANTWYAGTNTSGDTEYPAIWGKLYTWANAPTACPTGRHLPSDAEFETLETTLNGGTNCRNATNGWRCLGLGWQLHNTRTTANNMAQALKIPLAGGRNIDGSSFYGRGSFAVFWSSSAFDATSAYYRYMLYGNVTVDRNILAKTRSYSVRCVKDSVYPGCDSPDIMVGGYTISACNVGATTAGTGATSYGNYFQWGNNAGTSGTVTTSTGIVNASTYGPGNYYNDPTFIISATDWASPQNNDLWGNTTNTTAARQGPCATGYHVPKEAEWIGISSAGGWGASGTNMMNALKLPMAGQRVSTSGSMGGANNGRYWASSINGTYASSLRFYSTNVYTGNLGARASGFTVRCFKN